MLYKHDFFAKFAIKYIFCYSYLSVPLGFTMGYHGYSLQDFATKHMGRVSSVLFGEGAEHH